MGREVDHVSRDDRRRGQGPLDEGRFARCLRGVPARHFQEGAAAQRALRILPRRRSQDEFLPRRRGVRAGHGQSASARGAALSHDPHEAEFSGELRRGGGGNREAFQ